MGGCDTCGVVYDGAPKLFASIDGKAYCATCWKRAGRPWPKRKLTDVEVSNAEIRVRERMLKRGGNSKYMARSGKV